MRDQTQSGRAFQRAVKQATRDLRGMLLGLIEWASISSASAGGSGAPTATTSEGEEIQVLEPYGFGASPPGSSTAILVAPGTESQDRIALGLSSMGGRPATDAGDAVMWSAAGHSVMLDDDGGITVTAKDGSSIDLDDLGAITINAGTAASITINVDVGASVNIGGAGAASLALGQKVIDAVDAMLLGGLPVPGDGGAGLKTSMTSAWNLIKATIPTTRAKGI